MELCHCIENIMAQLQTYISHYLPVEQSNCVNYCQGCQLPDFSLRSHNFCFTADFFTIFYIYLKPRLICKSHHKTTSKHPKTQEFWLYFSKKILWLQAKTEKASPSLHPAGSSCALARLWPAVTRVLSTSENLQNFLKHNVGNPHYCYVMPSVTNIKF